MSDSFHHVELPGAASVDGFHVVGPAVLYGRLGKGASGAVFVGVDLLTGEDVAVKCLLHADPRVEERFRQEARLGAAIDHPAIVKVRRIGRDRKSRLRYFIMDLVAGESIEERVRRSGPMSLSDATSLLVGVTRGIAALHEKGIVHRDVKPANVLISTDGQVRIADLGLLKEVGGVSEITMTGDLLGTPSYAAPEQWEDPRGAGLPADVYSLGATYRFVLTGKAPSRRIPGREVDDDWSGSLDMPASVRAWISSATAVDPAHRFESAVEALPSLLAIEAEVGPGRLHDPIAAEQVDAWRAIRPTDAVIDRIRRQVKPRADDPLDEEEGTVRRLTIALIALIAIALGIAVGLWFRDGS